MLLELVPSGCMPMPWGEMSGERYRTVGPLVVIIIIMIIGVQKINNFFLSNHSF